MLPLGPPLSSPVGEVEQQGAQERLRLQECNTDQRETHFLVPSVMLWSGINLLISLTQPFTHHQPPTHSFTHLLAWRSSTSSLCNNTIASVKQGDSVKVTPLCKTKQVFVDYKCINQSFHDVEQLAKVEGCKHHPSASSVSALAVRSIYEHFRWS